MHENHFATLRSTLYYMDVYIMSLDYDITMGCALKPSPPPHTHTQGPEVCGTRTGNF
jgi:hypothetical protein